MFNEYEYIFQVRARKSEVLHMLAHCSESIGKIRKGFSYLLELFLYGFIIPLTSGDYFDHFCIETSEDFTQK